MDTMGVINYHLIGVNKFYQKLKIFPPHLWVLYDSKLILPNNYIYFCIKYNFKT